MSAEIINSNEGLLTIRMQGKLTYPQFTAVQCRAAEVLRQQQKVRILVLAENFQGWEQQGDWGDLSFQIENDQHIEKMAIVGDKKWQDLALVFAAQGFRRFPIQFFPPEELVQAHVWLREESDS